MHSTGACAVDVLTDLKASTDILFYAHGAGEMTWQVECRWTSERTRAWILRPHAKACCAVHVCNPSVGGQGQLDTAPAS